MVASIHACLEGEFIEPETALLRQGNLNILIDGTPIKLIRYNSWNNGQLNRFQIWSASDNGRHEYPITGRSIHYYKEKIRANYEEDLDTLIQEGMGRTWMEVGAGLAELIPDLAVRQSRFNGSKPVVVDPLDYEKLRDVLLFIGSIVGDLSIAEVSPGGKNLDIVLDRLAILSDESYVKRIPAPFELTEMQVLEPLKGRVFTLIDCWGASRYCSTNSFPVYYSDLISNDGKVLIIE